MSSEETKARQRGYYLQNKERFKTNAARYRAKNPEYYRNYKLWSRYGITIEEYRDLLVKQGEVCAICGGPSTLRSGMFDVDHDHFTFGIRGLLCRLCNTAIGKLKTPDVLRRAAAYLEKTK
jgi:hypothetical protein